MKTSREVIDMLLEKFDSGEVFRYAQPAFIISKSAKPSAGWSFLNKMTMLLSGTEDARGIRQWNAVGRRVKKGAKALSILAPKVSKVSKATEEDVFVLHGFFCVPVFAVEDTEGEAVKQETFAPAALPILQEVADSWGITVKYESVPKSGNFTPSAYYSASRKTIVCYTYEEQTFLHELCHAAHHKIKGHLAPGQDTKQEFIAEFSSACLARIYGIYTEERECAALAYCQGYLKKEKNPGAMVMSAISEVDKIIKMMLEIKAIAIAA